MACVKACARRWLFAAVFLGVLGAALFGAGAHGQPIGIAGLLNPEGSRIFPQAIVFPRHPGKPDPRWRSFNWNFADLSAEGVKYRLYFYDEEVWTARYAIPKLNEQIKELKDVFGYAPSKTFSYVLFSSRREFQQANIFNISEGILGITSTTEATMAIPYWGQSEIFRHISTHELVHQFQVQKINDLGKGTAQLSMSLTPLWFIEGMAEYYSLKGIDSETRAFIRDLLLYPDKDRGHVMPKFMEEGTPSFISTYKAGQAKIDFIESTFGKGTAQRILEASAGSLGREYKTFTALLVKHLALKAEQLEEKWKSYLETSYKAEADKLSQSMDDFEEIKEAGDTLDLFRVSPDGSLLAIREIDPLSFTTSIKILDFKNQKRKIEVAHDNQPGLLSLYFLQMPTVALSNGLVAYVVATTSGPEVEIRSLTRNGSGKLVVGDATTRIELHRYQITQAHSVSISSDERKIVLVGLSAEGWENLYLIDLATKDSAWQVRNITQDTYSWLDPVWVKDGIIVSSDRTVNGRYALFQVNPDKGAIKQLSASDFDQLGIDGDLEKVVFHSLESGSSQIHAFSGGVETRLTEAKTALTYPSPRQGELYALGYRGGRYRVYHIPKTRILSKGVKTSSKLVAPVTAEPWKPRLETFASRQVQAYRPFFSSGVRLDNVAGFFGSGGVGGAAFTISDLMRNYSVSAEFSVLGSFKYTNSYVFLTSQRERSTWTAGAYHIVQTRLDTAIPLNGGSDDVARTYLHREFGGLAALQYPLTAFSFADFELRIAGVNRSQFSDAAKAAEWNALNPGPEFMLAPVVRIGYDRILYETFSGPLKGFGLLLESDTSTFPARGSASERIRLDVAHYVQVIERMVLQFQGIGGISFGGRFGNPFFVSSEDIMRAYPFADDRLRGNYLLAAKSELRFPIGSLFKFPPLRGFVALDYGSVFKKIGQAAQGISSSYTGGLSLNLPPISFNLMLSQPIKAAAGPPIDAPVVHFTLRYLYL